MLTAVQVGKLLDRLCVDLGFCLPPDDYMRLAENPPGDVRSFVDAVFTSEGMNPEMADRHLYRQVTNVVREAFQRDSDPCA